MQSNPQSNPVFWNGFQIQVQSTKKECNQDFAILQSQSYRCLSIREEPPRDRQADTGQLEYSCACGGGTCQALGHRATWAKHRLQGTGGRGNMQSAIHIDRITSLTPG